MVCLGLEPRVAGLEAQTKTLSYGSTLRSNCCLQNHLESRTITNEIMNYLKPSKFQSIGGKAGTTKAFTI